jgi:mono/diheme cytochrome c family protein
MNHKSMSAWVGALAMILGTDVAAAAKASTPDSAALLGANDNEWILPAKNYEGNPYSPQASRVLAYRLGATQPVVNSSDGQVTAGAAVYAQHCAVCHGAQLQGVAAPAIAGPAFARTKPTLAQLHTVVTKNMPLTAPGTFPAADYAAIMAYMLSCECVKPSGDGKMPFPTTDISALKPITFGAKICPPGGGKE